MSARSSNQTAISMSLPKELLQEIDRRASSLGLSRSSYLSLLAQRDLRELGPLTVHGREAGSGNEIELTPDAYEFLKAAVPQLEAWQKHCEDGSPLPDPPPAPSATLQAIWERFLAQRQSIMDHKWYESEKAGHDIGIERAILDWIEKHAPPLSARE